MKILVIACVVVSVFFAVFCLSGEEKQKKGSQKALASLNELVAYIQDGEFEKFEALLKKYPDTMLNQTVQIDDDSDDDVKETLIGLAVKQNRLDIVRSLLANGMDVNFQDDRRWTALHHSVGEGHLEISKYLL